MPNDPSNAVFQSILAPFMEKFLQEKHACGYRYHDPTRILRHFDHFLVQEGLTTYELPRSIAQKWLAKRAHEHPRTHQQRIMVVRQFSRFLCRLGYCAYVPDSTWLLESQSSFTPRILTPEEVRKLLESVDALEPTARSPLRHLIMPEVFRLLYGCGFRLSRHLAPGQDGGRRFARHPAEPRRPAGPVSSDCCGELSCRCDLRARTAGNFDGER